jgi:hypothetical protein
MRPHVAFTDSLLSRLARRGGVKRISAPIYEDLRAALAQFLREVEILLERRLARLDTEGVFRSLRTVRSSWTTPAGRRSLLQT